MRISWRSMSSPDRILFIRLSALGDVLLATPAVRALKKRFPSACIHWLVEKPYMPLLAGNPHVEPLAYHKRGTHQGASGLWKLRRQLGEARYDLVVDLQGKPRTWLLRSAGRTSHAVRKRTAGQALLALVGHDPPRAALHAVDQYLQALEPLGVEPDGRHMDLMITESMRVEADPVVRGSPIGLSVATRWPTKDWPVERWAALAQQLVKQGEQVLLLGGPGEARAMEGVRAAVGEPIRDTAALSVGGLAAAVARCKAVVSGDSGPVHMASAVGTPVVALFGPTSPQRWGPISPRSRVIRLPLSCSPCSNHGSQTCPRKHHDCMKQLGVEMVVEALRGM